ncbi:MAG: DUF2357 domain-containing protein [Bacilli bacterium]|nr:DUF2357 domain-containing protein [Bacilli bacterium]
MVSPPSGYHDAVELVKIETKDFSLVIKGKAYHERYEGFKSYQIMDFHDEMFFSFQGENILEVKVFDVESEKIHSPSSGLRPIFFENGIYQLIVIPKTERDLSFYHEHPGLRKSITRHKIGTKNILMGNLHFQNEIGYSTFEIRSENETLLSVTFEIFPVKLDYKKDYQKLLKEVSEEIYNLAFHLLRKTYLKTRIKSDGKPTRTEFYRLIEHHFEQFIQSIQQIEKQPYHELDKIYEKARGDQLSKQDSYTLKFLRKRPHLFIKVNNGITISGKKMLPVEGLRIRKRLTFDTLENRYVKWMMIRLNHKLTDVLEKIYEEHRKIHDDLDEELVDNIKHMITRLKQKLESTFWKKVGKLDRSIMSLVLQMAPGYKDAFQIYLIVSKGLALQGDIYRMSVKDVAVLYEYWTFIKMGKILAKKYEMVSQDIVKVKNDGLYVNLLADRRAKRVFRHPVTGEEIELIYQHKHGNLPTTSQIPDTMLKISKKGKEYTFDYIFDAKYRIDYALEGSSYGRKYGSPGPMEEDINTMHRYRDAIVANYDGPFVRTAFGAYVLFPWYDEHAYQYHHFYKSIDQVNIGGFPFLPNASMLVEKFIERIIDKSAEELQREGILPRGTIKEWKSSLDEKVLVGLVSTIEKYREFIQEKYYYLNKDILRKDWHGAKYVALYLKKDVLTDENGVTVYGKIEEITFHNEKVKFHVEYWTNLPSVIKPVNYGIATYIITTLNTLKEANELPELFMKSNEEMILWRMLRRVSDQIKMDLDNPILDQAKKVKEYQIKDVQVQLEPDYNRLVLLRKDHEIIFDLDDLNRKPTTVFRKLIKLIQMK